MKQAIVKEVGRLLGATFPMPASVSVILNGVFGIEKLGRRV
jgi:hypothetical protein